MTLRTACRGTLLMTAAMVVACSSESPDGTGNAPGGGSGGSQGGGAGGAAGQGQVAGSGGLGGMRGGSAGVGGSTDGGTGGELTPVEEECTEVTERREPTVVERVIDKADIIWVVDSSFSMADEAMRVQQNINQFVDFVESNRIDVHVVLITAAGFMQVPDPLGSDTSRFLRIDAPVDSGAPLVQLVAQYGAYEDFLRPEAITHFIAVTDDESIMPAPTFEQQMRDALGRDFFFHAIASEDVAGGGSGACNALIGTACGGGLTVIGAAAPGCQYYALSDMTGGAKISICTPPDQWPDFITDTLGQTVVDSIPEPLPCDYLIPDPPDGESLDPDQVNVEHTPPGGTGKVFGRVDGRDKCAQHISWYYDDPAAPSQIKLCPAACDRATQGGDINIVFGCETVVVIE